MSRLTYSKIQTGPRSDLPAVAQLMYWLMLRNVTGEGITYVDWKEPHPTSLRGCIIASPSYPLDDVPETTQDYVFNWVRDAAIVAMELAHSGQDVADSYVSRRLSDYVHFARLCQDNEPEGDLFQAVYTIDAQPRPAWSKQSDGPALQTLAIVQAFGQLSEADQEMARTVASKNLAFLLEDDRYRTRSTNLWEEIEGQSFFARSVQLCCLREMRKNPIGAVLPPGIDEAIAWLSKELDTYWDATDGYYISVMDARNPRPGYDPNSDIVMACIYGAVSPTDPKLLATAAKIRDQWANPAGPTVYPINIEDAKIGLGPLLGRYPGDTYDGDHNAPAKGHPWPVCTANFAALYYRVAATVRAGGSVPYTELSRDFFDQVGVASEMSPEDAVQLLEAAGDRMLQAIIRHSDHLALSEQIDATTGFEKSVYNLTWSYAAFLGAVRARAALSKVV